MGVSLEIWRMRIGCFRQRPPSSCKTTTEVNFSPSPPLFGIGSGTFLFILISVCAGAALMTHSEDLTVYGDVEKNPGPPNTPDLQESLLKSLKNGTCTTAVADLGHELKHKHVMQLFQLKSNWAEAVAWMKILYPSRSFDDTKKWQRLLRDSWTKLKTTYTKMNKNIGREGVKEEMDSWEETNYKFPEPQPPKEKPAPPVIPPSLFEINVAKTEIEKLTKANQNLKEENDNLIKQVEELKMRPSPHTQQNTARREKDHWLKIYYEREQATRLEKDNRRLEKQLESVKSSKRDLTSEFESAAKKVKKDHVSEIEWYKEYTSDLKSENTELREKVINLNAKMDSLMEEIDELTGKLHEAKDRTINFYDPEKRCFLPLIHKCVWDLITKHVSFSNVSAVIAIVLDTCNMKYDRLPSESTIRSMNKDRILVSQIQLASIASNKDTTIQTDETPKHGNIYMTYAITDQEGESYLLGLRQMASKSAKDTLETLKETLADITDICEKASAGSDIGHQLLCQIRNTMSDRAATETLFNKMLQTYREECLPLFYKNWQHFSEEAQGKLAEMHNFFCGLHLLTSMADAVAASFKLFESDYLDGKKVGACAEPGITVFNTTSGSIRLVQNACKALSRGGDEKNGCFRAWKTYKKGKNITKTYFLPFRGNRFNVVFMFGGRVYYLMHHIEEFLSNVHGTANGLLKALLADVKEVLFVAGCKVLGMVNKGISAPLWRVTEEPGHILDLCKTYSGLVEYLEKVTQDEDRLADFAYGRDNFFEERYVEKDEVYNVVFRPGPDDIDEIALSMLKHTLLTLLQLFKRVNADYLPGGKFYKLRGDEDIRQATLSAPLTNKLPERVFGYFDFLVKKRPNSSAAANEAQVLYSFNKTSEFVNSKSEEELAELVKVVKSQRSKSKSIASARQKKIQDYWKNKQDASAKKMAESRQRALSKKENLTTDIMDTGLFQSDEQVEEYISSEANENKKIDTLKKQIRFRREVLQQYMEGDKKFTFTDAVPGSKNRKNKSSEELKSHLSKLINAAKNVPESVSVQKTPDNEFLTIPLLVGKRVSHMWNTENGQEWFTGTVISQVPGFPSWFNIKYDDEPKVHSLRLVDDYKDKSLYILV